VSLIELRGVRKAFGEKVGYRELSLAIERGESITIIGGSGCGKSVMLKLLIGLLRPDQGEILFDGQDVARMRSAELQQLRQRVGMLFQGGALFDSISVGDNVAYALREHARSMGVSEIGSRVAWALDVVGLPGIEKMRTNDLSGGMKKRVALARAIVQGPEVVLYDEPTTGLDPINVTRINRLIVALKHELKITSIVVTHDMQSAYAISDRLAMLHEGRILLTGTPDDFRRSELPAVRDFVVGYAPAHEGRHSLEVN
jgi:phospholipid/cholesterol/gamma-HCH transport system ATP-binding protein